MLGKDIKAGKCYHCTDCKTRYEKDYVRYDGSRDCGNFSKTECYIKVKSVEAVKKNDYMPSKQVTFKEIVSLDPQQIISASCCFNNKRRAFLTEISQAEFDRVLTAQEV